MRTIIFEAENSETEKIKNVLKALGITRIKDVECSKFPQFDKVKYTQKEFEEMLDFSEKTKCSAVLKNKEDIIDFIGSL